MRGGESGRVVASLSIPINRRCLAVVVVVITFYFFIRFGFFIFRLALFRSCFFFCFASIIILVEAIYDGPDARPVPPPDCKPRACNAYTARRCPLKYGLIAG